MASSEFSAYTANPTEIQNAIDFGLPLEIGSPVDIALVDDDANLDLSGDPTQQLNRNPSESLTEPVQDIQILDITNNGETITVAAIVPEGVAISYLVPLDAATGTTLTGILPSDPDLSGPSGSATPTGNAPSSVAYCFAGDTLIATPDGAKRVDTLAIGEEVMVAGGGSAKVRWIGRQTVDLRLGPPERLLPVRIKRGALGDNMPSKDLVLTRDHAVFVCGILANAGALINGTSIVSVTCEEIGPVVTYYHVDTFAHQLVLANDVPAETLIEPRDARAHFDNYDDYVARFGEGQADTPVLFYPRAMSRRQLPTRVHEHLDARAAMLFPVQQRVAARASQQPRSNVSTA